MNNLQQLFAKKREKLLNIYFTAGFPNLNDTETIILELEKAGVDMIELGMPYSDPLADGPTIQESGTIALENGMTLPLLFEQIANVRKKSNIPLILMGYFNQVMQYGEEAFISKCVEVGVDGVILPDLPLFEYETLYRDKFERAGLDISFLVTPQTSEERILQVDKLSTGFVYVVSDSSITGKSGGISPQQMAYFERVQGSDFRNLKLIGFGISDKQTYETACTYANGAIIGSAFIRTLKGSKDLASDIQSFIKGIRSN